MRRRHLLIALLLAAAAVTTVSFAGGAGAAPHFSQACNLRGSWVASNAETNAYFQALNPTTGEIRVVSGALSMTFTRTTWSFGGLGLRLVGKRGRTTIKEELDIEAEAPYAVRGSTIRLGKGTFKIRHINTTLTTAGKTAPVTLANVSSASPPKDVPYTCTPRVLRVTVNAGLTSVPLTLRRER